LTIVVDIGKGDDDTMSRIDYSKWDNLDCSSSSEDEDGNGPARVTKLDGPSQVTFGGGGDGSTIQIEPSSFSAPVATTSPASRPVSTTTVLADSRKKLDPIEQRDQEQKQWTEKGGMVQVPCGSCSGSGSPVTPTCHLYWSQTRYAVTLRLEFVQGGEVGATTTSPAIHSKDIRVTVEGILPFQERQMAVGTLKPKLQVYASTATNEKIVLLHDELPHPVHLPQDDEEEETGNLKKNHGQVVGVRPLDWVIERQVLTDAPYISITLFKAVPMMGMSIWWKRPLLSVPELDYNVINPGDRANSCTTGNTNNNGQAFAQAWEEAHRMFREKRQQENENDV
jgi:hypothetical protein